MRIYAGFWYLLVPFIKCLISIFLVLSIESPQSFALRCIFSISLLASISFYIGSISMAIHTTRYAKKAIIQPHNEWDVKTIFKSVIHNNIHLKLIITYLILLETGTILHCIAWITSFENNSNYLFLISLIIICASLIIYLYIEYKSFKAERMETIEIIWKTLLCILLISLLFITSLKYDFNLNIHESILIILFAICLIFSESLFDIKYITFRFGRPDRRRYGPPIDPSDCVFFVPKCCNCSIFIIFFILICINQSNNITITFIPLWVFWVCQICQLALKFVDDEQPFLKLENPESPIILSHLTDNTLLSNLNKCIAEKRKLISLKNRRRCNNVICDIISPNHVSLDSANYVNFMEYTHTENEYDLKLEDFKWFTYQWIPTDFELGLKDSFNGISNNINDFLNIKLKSGFIPDINYLKHQKLYEYILQYLQKYIVLLFANNDQELLLKWCRDNKILRIIIKSQQFEFREDVNIDTYYGSKHLEGTGQEKISQIALLYTQIDRNIIGGDLVVDSFRISRLQSGDIVVFKNCNHRMLSISSTFKSNEKPPIRRFLAFFLCENDTEKFCKTYLYKNLVRNDDYVFAEDKKYWETQQRNAKLPLITATDIYPILEENFNDFVQLHLHKNVLNIHGIDIPEIVLSVICRYMIVVQLRDNDLADTYADELRGFRGHCQQQREKADYPMNCD